MSRMRHATAGPRGGCPRSRRVGWRCLLVQVQRGADVHLSDSTGKVSTARTRSVLAWADVAGRPVVDRLPTGVYAVHGRRGRVARRTHSHTFVLYGNSNDAVGIRRGLAFPCQITFIRTAVWGRCNFPSADRSGFACVTILYTQAGDLRAIRSLDAQCDTLRAPSDCRAEAPTANDDRYRAAVAAVDVSDGKTSCPGRSARLRDPARDRTPGETGCARGRPHPSARCFLSGRG